MLDTLTQTGPRWRRDDYNVEARLNRLLAANRHEAARRRLFRNPGDEEQVRLMRHPIQTERAYALFGMLLGAWPPAAIFYRFLSFATPLNSYDVSFLFSLCLLMNMVCMLVGRKVGAQIGRSIDEIEHKSWSRMVVLAALSGLWWGVATGAAGGALCFGTGAIFGALLALPVGFVGFIFFTAFHRAVARGGMIDARHFWPLSCGVAAFIAALILGR